MQQIHLAGHENHGDYLIDTHDHPVPDPVWELYAAALRRFGPVSTMIERDANIPPLAELVAELEQARARSAQVLAAAASLGRSAAARPRRRQRAVNTLAQVQGDFQEYLLRGDRAIEAHVVGTARVPVATRLAIYGDGYGSRLAEALASNFPALAQLLGEADFQALAASYVRAHDSPYFSIRYYGDAAGAVPRGRCAVLRRPGAGGAGPLGMGDAAGVRCGRCHAGHARGAGAACGRSSGRSCASACTRACSAWSCTGTRRRSGRPSPRAATRPR